MGFANRPGHGIGWHGMMDHLLGGSKPGFHLGSFKIPAEPAEGVFSAETNFVHAGDFGAAS